MVPTHRAVYLLDEIADMARQSPEAATAIAEAVQKKLAAKNPVVKFKVGAQFVLFPPCSLRQQRALIPQLLAYLLQALRIIKHLSTKGCSHFQRCMQRHSTCVRWGASCASCAACHRRRAASNTTHAVRACAALQSFRVAPCSPHQHPPPQTLSSNHPHQGAQLHLSP